MMSSPVETRPKLKIGATSLLEACPRSLRAFLHQLNHGDNEIDKPIAMYAVRGANTPNNAYFLSSIQNTKYLFSSLTIKKG